MAAFVEHGGVDGHRVRHGVPLPSIPPERACPEQVVLLGSPDRDGAGRAPAILVPQLNHRLLAIGRGGLGFVVQTLRVIARPHLQVQNDLRNPAKLPWLLLRPTQLQTNLLLPG
jgi:hypothetical protein